MSATTDRTPPAETKRCSSCTSNRPLDWFQSKTPGSHGLSGTSMKTCKQCRERVAAFRKRGRGVKAAAKPTKPRPVSEHQLAAKNPTSHLLGRPGTSDSITKGSAQNVEFGNMQNTFETIKLLDDEDEINAAADLLLGQIEESEESDNGEDVTCSDDGEGRSRKD